MRYYLILFFIFFGVSALAASTFKDVSRTANVYQRETPADAESGAWWGPGTAAVDYDRRRLLDGHLRRRRWRFAERTLSQ